MKGYCTFVLQYLKVIIGLLQWPTCAKIIYLNLFFIGKVMALILHLQLLIGTCVNFIEMFPLKIDPWGPLFGPSLEKLVTHILGHA